MTIQTNTANRKVLADQLSRQIGEPYRYLGVPSCAYQVGPYTINKDGSITGEDFKAIQGFLTENGYISAADNAGAETAGGTEEQPAEAAADRHADPEAENGMENEPADRLSVCIPLNNYSVLGLTCLLKTLHARQCLINAMTGSKSIRVDEELVSRLDDEKPATVEQVLFILQGEIEADMVKGISIDDGKIHMDFPFDANQPLKWQAYAELLLAVEEHSRGARRSAAKKIEPEASEMKYFCRNWLMQLGLGGTEHRETRNILLGHLTGFAAFRTPEKMDAHKARCAEHRKLAKENRSNSETEVSGND